MPVYQLTSPTTLLVTFTAEEAGIIARAQQEGVASFTNAVDAVISKFRDRYDAEDKSRVVNLFGQASAAKRSEVLTLLES